MNRFMYKKRPIFKKLVLRVLEKIMVRIFVSYARKNIDFAKRLRGIL